MKHALYQLSYIDKIVKLIAPKYDENSQYISTKKRIDLIKVRQTQLRLDRCVSMLKKVAVNKRKQYYKY